MFTKDSRAEQFLTSLGATWKYTNKMTLSVMCRDWYKQNLGRSEPQVESAVDEYYSLMQAGSAAPAPLLSQSHEGYDVLDGVQRLLAVQRKNPAVFSAYIVTTDSPSLVLQIRVFANLRLQGGHQERAEWTMENAISLCDGDRMTLNDIAALGGWSLSKVQEKKQIMDLRQKISGAGGPEKLSDAMMRASIPHIHASDIESAPVPIGEFYCDLKTMRLSADEASPYIASFFSIARSKGKPYSQFSTKLNEFRKTDEVKARLSDPARICYQPMTEEGKLLRALRAAETIATRCVDLKISIRDVEPYFQSVNKLRKSIQKIGGRT